MNSLSIISALFRSTSSVAAMELAKTFSGYGNDHIHVEELLSEQYCCDIFFSSNLINRM